MTWLLTSAIALRNNSLMQIEWHFSLNTDRHKNGRAIYLLWAIYLADHISRQPDYLYANRVSRIADDQNVHIQKQHPLYYLWSPVGVCLCKISISNTFLWQWIPPFRSKKHLKLSLIPPLSERIYTRYDSYRLERMQSTICPQGYRSFQPTSSSQSLLSRSTPLNPDQLWRGRRRA